ncbi:MAG: four helix bundle protein [Verrucomicrobiota bacterium]
MTRPKNISGSIFIENQPPDLNLNPNPNPERHSLMAPIFDHEKLEVYMMAIEFTAWTGELLEDIPKTIAAWKQLDRASTSIPLNIAEGNGKFTPADKCKFIDIARGSALECAAALDVLVARKYVVGGRIEEGKNLLRQIVSMLIGLIKYTSPDRVHEERVQYRIDKD